MGFAPALTLEIHPEQYETWIELEQGPMAGAARTAALHGLQRHLHGVVNPPNPHSYGRLAGMANHSERGHSGAISKYVILREANGRTAQTALAYLQMVDKALSPKIQGAVRVLASSIGRVSKNRNKGISR
jgi:hypothetical protein